MAIAPVRSTLLSRTVVRLLPGAAFVVLAALAVPVTIRASALADRSAARAAVLSAARQEITHLVNIDYRTAERDLDRIVAGATGRLAQLFAAEHEQLQLLASNQSVTTGSVLAAGLEKLDLSAGIARVDVAADASLTDVQHPAGAVKHYRWVLTLQRVHGDWLVSDAALAGVPQ